MKKVTLLILPVVMLFVCSDVLALKSAVTLSPLNLKQEGFSVTTAKRDDGTVDITVTRDLSKARSFDAKSDLELVRDATLEVGGSAGVMVRCKVAPESGKDAVIYRFRIAAKQLAHSTVTISEIDDYKKTELREHLIGGGTIYTIQLVEVVK